MIVFRNPGLIELDAVTTMGVSVNNPGSFGRFGTGIKYALATILRGGGRVAIWRGEEPHVFNTKTKQIRGEDFDLVWMDQLPLGFTTSLGKDWQPWMVLRELGCNALDEGGSFGPMDGGFDPAIHTKVLREGWTTVIVDWEPLDEALKHRADIFVQGEALYSNPHVRVLPGPSDHLFYRGVRVYKLDRPSVFRYDLLDEQSLTEDRTLTGPYTAQRIVAELLLGCEDTEVIGGAVLAGEGTWESKLDFTSYEATQPSKAFIDTVLLARERRDKGLSPKARERVSKQLRSESDGYVTQTRYLGVEDSFSEAVGYLGDLGLELDFDKQKVVITDDLPEGVESSTEGSRVYVTRALLRRPVREIAEAMARRIIDLEELWDASQAVDFLLPLLLAQHSRLRADTVRGEQEAAEEAA